MDVDDLAIGKLACDPLAGFARRFAERLRKGADSIDERIELAVRLTLNRDPERQESAILSDYVRGQGLENLARLLFNSNEFLFVD